MKIKYAGLVLLCFLALVTAFSCKSTPAAETGGETIGPSDDLEAAAARALAARKLVSDFEGSISYEEDWLAADALYDEAEQGKSTASAQETTESVKRYVAAAEAFEAMSEKVLEKYFENKEAELIAARDIAVEAGAEELVPDLLFDADTTVVRAFDEYEAKDYYKAKDSAFEALSMYQVLRSGLEAYALREVIMKRNLESYDPESIELADKTILAAISDYSARDIPGAKEKVDAAALRYNMVLNSAFESYAAGKGAEAAEVRQRALDVRANVAVRNEFNSAQEVYTRANAALKDQKYGEAALGYEDSIRRFTSAIENTLAKKTVAEEALEKANQVLAESDEIARNAEIILEGGE